MSMRGLVVPAGSGARQFHVRQVAHREASNLQAPFKPFACWVMPYDGTCEDCASRQFMVLWKTMPLWARRENARINSNRKTLVCACFGELIE